MMPQVTFLMAVFNNAATVGAAVESVLAQEFTDFELLVIDDGCHDGTADVLARYNDSRIRILQNDRNRGLSWSLNRGLHEARGELIARMDADDVCLPARAGVQVAYLREHPRVAVVGSFIRTFRADGDAGKVVCYPTTPEQVEATLLFRNVLAHPAVMVRHDTLQAAGLHYDEAYRCAQDYGLWLACIAHGLPLANVGEVLLRYRLHPGQLSHTYSGGMQEEGRIIRERLLRHLLPGVTPEQLATHDAMARDYLPAEPAALGAADAWLRQLYLWNEGHCRFAPGAFGPVLCGRWVRVLKLARSAGLRLDINGHPLARYLHADVRTELTSAILETA
jgi:hypothetical protein